MRYSRLSMVIVDVLVLDSVRVWRMHGLRYRLRHATTDETAHSVGDGTRACSIDPLDVHLGMTPDLRYELENDNRVSNIASQVIPSNADSHERQEGCRTLT